MTPRLQRSFLVACFALLTARLAAQPVKTEPVTRGDFTPAILATGTVEPIGLVEVVPQVSGTVSKRGPGVDFRDHVKEGQMLLQLDKDFLGVRLEQEIAHVAKLEAELQQAKLKLESAAGAEAKSAEAAVKVAEAGLLEGRADLKEAQMNLDATTISATASGMIMARNGGDPGQAIGPNPNGPPLFVIWPEGNKTQVWASVAETDVALVVPGQAVGFVCPGLPDKTFKGRVAKVHPTAAHVHEAVQYTVEIDTENRDGVLLPDLTAEVRIQTEARSNVLTVPNAALEWLPQGEILAAMRRQASGAPPEPPRHRRVWVQDGKVARPVEVKVAKSDGHRTEITSKDLKEGDQVIVDGALQ